VHTYDLIVLGAGSGNMLFGSELEPLRAAVIEPDRFGGTCLNRGCIPSKMLVVAADAARAVTEGKRLGVHATLDRVDWRSIRDRIFDRIDPLHDRLQTAISWLSGSRIEQYMSAHQHDPNANELWSHFQAVISWVQLTFTTYRKEMKGLDWGSLYNQFKDGCTGQHHLGL